MADGAPRVRVTVAWSPAPREVREWVLDLPAGATVSQALAASPLFTDFPSLREEALHLAVWGRPVTLQQVLRERDRVEVLRALRVDPKVARRERFKRQGARSAGLFARGPRGKPPSGEKP